MPLRHCSKTRAGTVNDYINSYASRLSLLAVFNSKAADCREHGMVSDFHVYFNHLVLR